MAYEHNEEWLKHERAALAVDWKAVNENFHEFLNFLACTTDWAEASVRFESNGGGSECPNVTFKVIACEEEES